SSFHQGNSVFLRISDGSGQIEWLSDSSFRFTRRWDGSFTKGPDMAASIGLKISDTPDSLKIATKYLLLTIAKNGVMTRVAEPDGTIIMADASEAELRNRVVAWERVAAPRVRFYGLGAREDGSVDLRGTRTDAIKPFLMSSAGYAEFHIAPG